MGVINVNFGIYDGPHHVQHRLHGLIIEHCIVPLWKFH